MSSGRQVSFFTFSRWSLCGLLCMLLVSSCFVVPRNYNPDKPFVYKTTINIEGKTPDYDRQELLTKLHDQMDDSLKTRPVSYAGVYYDLNRPPVFDSLNIGRSKVFMSKGLNSMGYFQPVIEDTFFIDTVPNRRKGEQKRVYISFNVKPGTATHIDSINYVLETPELQALALKTRRESLLKKGQPYADQKVLGELDRLVGLYRDSGYYKITKENIYAERDTVVAALIDPTLDPFEQIRLLDSLKKKREKPTISVTIRQRAVKDSSHIQKYYIGDVTVYPDQSILEDSSYTPTDSVTIQGYKFLYNTQRFKLPFIANNIRLRPGSLYSQRRYYRVINTFNQLGAWQNVDLNLQERKDSLPLLDAVLRLYPAMKYSLSVDYETSRNVSDFLSQGTFFGLGLNFRLLNRNAYREAIQTSTNARFGIEIGTHLVQTLQASVSHNIYFPKIIIPKVNLPEWIKDIFPRRVDGTERTIARRTVLNLAGTYTDRRDFFRAPSFNTSWGYEWTRRRSRSLDPDNAAQRWTKSYQLTPFNFEYTNLHKTDSLRKLEQDIPAYRFAFNDGMIISTIFSVTAGRQYDEDKRLTLIRGRIEESGALFGLFKNLELGDLRRFVKIDGEIKHYINYKKSSWAFRAFGGVAFIYGKTDTGGVVVKENNLPFFKAFFAGGPYSMRAWQVRRLGPGSSTLYDINDTTRVDRFGNMQLEFNAEYRFNLTTIAGIKINSALFVDIGNIWSKEYLNGVEVPEASFKLSRLYKDIAVGAGTSLRLDFEFFLIRLDWAYRLKNPRYATVNDGWFQKIDIASGQLQLGIGYPF